MQWQPSGENEKLIKGEIIHIGLYVETIKVNNYFVK